MKCTWQIETKNKINKMYLTFNLFSYFKLFLVEIIKQQVYIIFAWFNRWTAISLYTDYSWVSSHTSSPKKEKLPYFHQSCFPYVLHWHISVDRKWGSIWQFHLKVQSYMQWKYYQLHRARIPIFSRDLILLPISYTRKKRLIRENLMPQSIFN